jgi:hypothetical protein
MGAFSTASHPIGAVAMLLAVGLAGAGFSVMQSTLVFLAITPSLRGAAFGLLSVCIGASPLGLLLVGSVANLFGAAAAIKIFSVLGVLTIASAYARLAAGLEKRLGVLGSLKSRSRHHD